MYSECEKVKIKAIGLTGIIVDISERNGIRKYIVESDEPNPNVKGYGNIWPLFDCEEEDLEPIK